MTPRGGRAATHEWHVWIAVVRVLPACLNQVPSEPTWEMRDGGLEPPEFGIARRRRPDVPAHPHRLRPPPRDLKKIT